MGRTLSSISEIFSCLGVFYMQSQKPVAYTCYVFWCRELNFLSHKSQLPRYTTFVKFKNWSPWIWWGMRAHQYYMLLLEAIEWQVFSVKHWESDTSLNGVSVSQHLVKCLSNFQVSQCYYLGTIQCPFRTCIWHMQCLLIWVCIFVSIFTFSAGICLQGRYKWCFYFWPANMIETWPGSGSLKALHHFIGSKLIHPKKHEKHHLLDKGVL